MQQAVLLMFQLVQEQQYLHIEVSRRLAKSGPFLDSVPLDGGRRLDLPNNTLVVNTLTSDPGAASKLYQWMLPFFERLPYQVTSFVVATATEIGGIDSNGNVGRAAIPQPGQPQAVTQVHAAVPTWQLALSDGPFPWGAKPEDLDG